LRKIAACDGTALLWISRDLRELGQYRRTRCPVPETWDKLDAVPLIRVRRVSRIKYRIGNGYLLRGIAMHIELELDDQLAKRLLQQQQNLNKQLAEIITDILAEAVENPPVAKETEGQKVLRILEQHQLLGCMEGDGNLSVDYKKHLWDDK
jgi:hypothetical protein